MAEPVSNAEIICLESEAFYALIAEIKTQIKAEHGIVHDKWISAREAMDILRISSRSTLQKFRDEGLVRYTQPSPKVILYDRESLLNLLDQNAQDTF